MPYTIRKGNGERPFKIIRKDTGEQVGSSKTKKDAEESIRARYSGERK
jgi:hypothetical protein